MLNLIPNWAQLTYYNRITLIDKSEGLAEDHAMEDMNQWRYIFIATYKTPECLWIQLYYVAHISQLLKTELERSIKRHLIFRDYLHDWVILSGF